MGWWFEEANAFEFRRRRRQLTIEMRVFEFV
jgi:hypothetical protein